MEPVDEGDIHSAHEADLAGPAREGRRDAYQITAFMLPESVLAQIGTVQPGDVDDRELPVGIIGRHCVDCVRLGETHRNHHGCPAFHQFLYRLLAPGPVGYQQLFDPDARLVGELPQTIPDALVEALVELVVGVIDHRGPEVSGERGADHGDRQHRHAEKGENPHSGHSTNRCKGSSEGWVNFRDKSTDAGTIGTGWLSVFREECYGRRVHRRRR